MLKCIIFSNLRSYELEPVDTQENVKMKIDLVLRLKDGIHVKFKPREK